MKKDEQSYYTKKVVYGDNPLLEVIFELEDAVEYNSFLELTYVPRNKMQDILHRHGNTIKEFKTRLANLIN